MVSGTFTPAGPLQFFVLNGGTPLPTYGHQRPNFVGTPKRSHCSDTYLGE
jgi:hypothetical protein